MLETSLLHGGHASRMASHTRPASFRRPPFFGRNQSVWPLKFSLCFTIPYFFRGRTTRFRPAGLEIADCAVSTRGGVHALLCSRLLYYCHYRGDFWFWRDCSGCCWNREDLVLCFRCALHRQPLLWSATLAVRRLERASPLGMPLPTLDTGTTGFRRRTKNRETASKPHLPTRSFDPAGSASTKLAGLQRARRPGSLSRCFSAQVGRPSRPAGPSTRKRVVSPPDAVRPGGAHAVRRPWTERDASICVFACRDNQERFVNMLRQRRPLARLLMTVVVAICVGCKPADKAGGPANADSAASSSPTAASH
ncbi:hypothetical protein C7399_13233 [Paraburkholderia tropica]|uniref:Uncharacterized protein n=1 Tax=Paraburkholderia tropica TaxID=92647 RepID=A0ABX5MDX3_9BURK|nr:hypothetical protein C7400_13233 [Paraburkholderia tropica]PZW72491.1 hypothetical protein C7399_13233 [Paraburkholderia tropica]